METYRSETCIIIAVVSAYLRISKRGVKFLVQKDGRWKGMKNLGNERIDKLIEGEEILPLWKQRGYKYLLYSIYKKRMHWLCNAKKSKINQSLWGNKIKSRMGWIHSSIHLSISFLTMPYYLLSDLGRVIS